MKAMHYSLLYKLVLYTGNTMHFSKILNNETNFYNTLKDSSGKTLKKESVTNIAPTVDIIKLNTLNGIKIEQSFSNISNSYCFSINSVFNPPYTD